MFFDENVFDDMEICSWRRTKQCLVLRLGGFEGGNEELPDRFRCQQGALEDPESNGTLEDSQNAKQTLEDSNEIDGTSKILGKGLKIKELDE